MHLFRTGPFEVSPELVQSLEEGGSSDDGWSSEEEEEDLGAVERDWEHVPVTLPDVDSVSRIDPYQSTSPIRTGESIAPTPSTGLMSSAAASVASLWRAATGTSQYK